MTIKDGGNAFPTVAVAAENRGMTLRDYFAAAWMNGFISSQLDDMAPDACARKAYQIADAMLVEREMGK